MRNQIDGWVRLKVTPVVRNSVSHFSKLRILHAYKFENIIRFINEAEEHVFGEFYSFLGSI